MLNEVMEKEKKSKKLHHGFIMEIHSLKRLCFNDVDLLVLSDCFKNN